MNPYESLNRTNTEELGKWTQCILIVAKNYSAKKGVGMQCTVDQNNNY